MSFVISRRAFRHCRDFAIRPLQIHLIYSFLRARQVRHILLISILCLTVSAKRILGHSELILLISWTLNKVRLYVFWNCFNRLHPRSYFALSLQKLSFDVWRKRNLVNLFTVVLTLSLRPVRGFVEGPVARGIHCLPHFLDAVAV